MAVSREILRAYRQPVQSLRRQLAAGVGDPRVLAYIMLGCMLIFVSALPRAARDAHLSPEVPLDARIAGALLGWVIIAPLVMYALAAISHALCLIFGGKGDWFAARLALGWALFVSTPLWLFYGFVAGLVGPGAATSLTGAITFAGFMYLWGSCLWAAETPMKERG